MHDFRRMGLILSVSLCLGLGALAARAKPAATPDATGSAPTPKALAPAPTKGTTGTAPGHVVGDHVMVEWGGSWWASTTLAVLPDGRLVIHYDGWGDEWDEVVKLGRVRSELPGATGTKAGDAVFVEWKGSWWPAHVKAVAKGGYAIHYDGYGPEWDETVAATRVKRLGPPENG